MSTTLKPVHVDDGFKVYNGRTISCSFVATSTACNDKNPCIIHSFERTIKLFIHVAGADQAEDLSRALRASLNPPGNWTYWRLPRGRPRQTWLHLSTHLVTGDGREDALIRPGYQLSALNPPGNWRLPRGCPRQIWLHLSTHLVTEDGRQDALVRPGYISQPTW